MVWMLVSFPLSLRLASTPSPLRVPAIVSRLFPVASSLRPNRVAAPPAGKESGVTESDEKTRGEGVG